MIRIRSVSLNTLKALDYEVSGFRETLVETELSSAATIVSIGSVSSARSDAISNAILARSSPDRCPLECCEEIRTHENDKRDKFRQE